MTFVGRQRREVDDSEQFEKRFFRVVQSLEPAGCRSKHHDLALRLERCSKLPAEIVVDTSAERLQVFNHQYELPADTLRRIENDGTCTVPQGSLTPVSG